MLRIAILALAAATLAACASSRSLSGSLSDISSDAQLKAVLFADRSHDYGDIDLTIYEGTLLLTGTMRSDDGRNAAVANAWKADGVKAVIDEIIVGDKTSIGQGIEDSRIEAALRARLIGDEAVKSGDFKIAVSGGVVYLIGAARDEAQIARATAIAADVSDVVRVVSHVSLRAPG
jgi:osmotically-inducible protein OsmY